ncbi:hypothetical protein B0A48_17091 [Cryoendolithus antarcticus]|uniref:BZIP domain-containing protein n=1 Tax=Cryoendolithus antarcticus TaxID=1507870 RepID=A0A1V8SBF1_9PEZI|nr:hypothetical protein B0A48_17091 [Cryoendolithus antarcticus]
MESMEYNDYFPGQTQSFPWFEADDGAYGRNTGADGTIAIPTLEGTFDASTYMQNPLDYSNLDGAFSGSSMSGVLTSGNSASPTQQQQFSLLSNGSVDSGIALDMDNDLEAMANMHRRSRSGSEDKDNMTPAQTRRKAQNRAAQRAFRERKERHVRDLEAKLNLLTTTTTSLQSDNERLKLLLQRAQTENEVLRATASSSPTRQQFNHPGFVDDPSLLPSSRSTRSTSSDEDSTYDRTRLSNGLISTDTSSRPSPRTDGQLLSASATWDLLQSHPLYLSGAVDIGEVCERLKKMARCEGMGPMFCEAEVREVIEEVGRSGGDELL